MVKYFTPVFLLLLPLVVGGCSSHFLVTPPNPDTARFATESSLSSNEYKIFKPIDNLNDQNFSILMTSIDYPILGYQEYPAFVEEMLGHCGINDFVDFQYLENFVIANNLGDKVPSIDNRIGLHQLSKYTGPYLIIAADLTNQGFDWWVFTISIYDPVSSTVKFQASHRGWTGIEGLREPVLLPVFNALQEWLEASRETETQSTESYGT